ncbi:MAG: hypothetical protein P1T08_05900 [Acidimicrobiia bacterium]|nr:hypothetical protein [Acidimicrobiia bacterium]
MRRTAFTLVLILSACTGSTVETTGPTSATTAPAGPSATEPPIAGPTSTTSTTSTTTVPATVVPTASYQLLPSPDEDLAYTIGHMAIGDAGLVYAGDVSTTPRDHPNEGALWHFDGQVWTRALISDLTTTDEYGDSPHVSELVFWGGRYLAFLLGDPTAPESAASLLASIDGRTWQLEHLLPQRATGSSPGGIFATPESPPRPGGAGIAGVATTADEIVAVGWVTTSEGSTAALWHSLDGRDWTLTTTPNAVWPNEWASAISVGDSGWLLGGSGPIYGTTLLWFSEDGDDWTYIGDRFGEGAWWSFHELASGSNGLAVAAFDMDSATTSMWRSDEGITWAPTSEPPWPEGSAVSLASDGSTMARLRRLEDTTIVETSPDGLAWEGIAGLSSDPGNPDIFVESLGLDYWDDSLTLTRFMTPADYASASVEIWIDAPTAAVVLVPADDTLNVRHGVMATVIGELEPTATNVRPTGASDGAAGSLWVEILHNGILGWVNSIYLTEEVDDLAALDPSATIERFADGVFRAGEPLGSYVGAKGLTITHFDLPKHFTLNDDPMSDQTIYLWGNPGCGPDPDCAFQATFANQIADSFLSAWDDEDRRIEIDTPIAGGNGTLPEAVVPVLFRNFHFVAVHDPGDDPAYGGLDWITWYVYFDVVDGLPVVAGMSVDMWAP